MPAAVLVSSRNAPWLEKLAQRLRDEKQFSVARVSSGDQAQTILGENPPDLLIADLLVPEVDGLRLTRQLKAQSSDAKAILLSDCLAAERAWEAGVDLFLISTEKQNEILDSVMDFLAG